MWIAGGFPALLGLICWWFGDFGFCLGCCCIVAGLVMLVVVFRCCVRLACVCFRFWARELLLIGLLLIVLFY